jgi:hydroxymethylpyrimidine pyrophosphatase-like HAD family hydrolase
MVFATHDIKQNFPRFIKGKWWSIDDIQRLKPEEYRPYFHDPVISIQFMNPKEQLDEMYIHTIEDPIISKYTHILYFEDSFLPGMYWLEYNPINARKEVMVEQLLKKKGYSSDDLVVFGDNFNDVGMFQMAGTVVVVENAPEELKNTYADHICPSNKEGGVIQYIEDNLDELV